MSDQIKMTQLERPFAPSFEEIVRVREGVEHMARQMMREDMRARQSVDAIAAMAAGMIGEIEPGDERRAVWDAATNAAALMLARVNFEHHEIRSLRAERDHWRKLATEAVHLRPAAPIILPV